MATLTAHPEAPEVAANAPDAAANGEAPKRKGPPKKAVFGDRGEDGILKVKIKGKDVPEWDGKKFLPLYPKDFEHPADYLDWRADQMEKDVAKYRARAAEERTLGNVTDRKKARQLKAMHEKFAALQKEMAEAGFDVDALLNS